MKLVHWYIWYSAVPNITAHPSTASVPVTVLLYNGPLLCGFSVPIKGLKEIYDKTTTISAGVFILRILGRMFACLGWLGVSRLALAVHRPTDK